MGKQRKILLPSVGENAAITLKPKAAALCFDRVWGTSDDVVHPSIRCWGGTQVELSGTGLAADFNIKTNRTPIVAMVGPEDKKLEMMYASTDQGLASAFRKISRGFSGEHGTPLIPIYDFVKQRDKMYREGDNEIIVATLADLDIVDEEKLSWGQVIEFRSDKEMRGKYKRLLHWLDKETIGKSPNFIEDEIAQRLVDYNRALEKHGIKTLVGIIEEALGVKLVAGAAAATSTLNLAGHSTLGFLVGTGIVLGKVMIKLIQVKLEYDDVERGPNSEVSWVYEVRRQLSR